MAIALVLILFWGFLHFLWQIMTGSGEILSKRRAPFKSVKMTAEGKKGGFFIDPT